MRSGSRVFGAGMLIGAAAAAALLLVGFFLASMLPTASSAPKAPSAESLVVPSPTTRPPLPTATMTFTAIPPQTIPTNLPTDFYFNTTPTLDPIAEAITSGALVFSGPLSSQQQVALYRSSLNYMQSSVAASKKAAKDINGVGYGDPTNICGPLAAAVLRDAGVIAADIAPHDFWLLDPRTVSGKRILAKAFPLIGFVHMTYITPLNKVDWKTSPLHPGDFLFIWHGSGGNFDHMLTVNRVDNAGRAFAVTNYGTAEGYVISEAMLYDPSDTNAGLFHTWTKEHDAILGSTGFGGYEVWRARGQ